MQPVTAEDTKAVVEDLRGWLAGEPARGAGQYEGMFDLTHLLMELVEMFGVLEISGR